MTHSSMGYGGWKWWTMDNLHIITMKYTKNILLLVSDLIKGVCVWKNFFSLAYLTLILYYCIIQPIKWIRTRFFLSFLIAFARGSLLLLLEIPIFFAWQNGCIIQAFFGLITYMLYDRVFFLPFSVNKACII